MTVTVATVALNGEGHRVNREMVVRQAEWLQTEMGKINQSQRGDSTDVNISPPWRTYITANL